MNGVSDTGGGGVGVGAILYLDAPVYIWGVQGQTAYLTGVGRLAGGARGHTRQPAAPGIHPFETVCLPLSHSGNPGVDGVSHRGCELRNVSLRLRNVSLRLRNVSLRLENVSDLTGGVNCSCCATAYWCCGESRFCLPIPLCEIHTIYVWRILQGGL